jgi:aspartate/methionine/tyrosine aminotransferase
MIFPYFDKEPCDDIITVMSSELQPAERASQIITTSVDAFVRDKLPQAPNKLRAVNLCLIELFSKLHDARLGREFYPLQGTIGDIDPWEIGTDFNGELDPFEQGRFSNLTERLGLNPMPGGVVYGRVTQRQQEVAQGYVEKRKATGMPTHVPSRYYPEGGRGTEEARAVMAKEGEQIGLKAEVGDIWMGYGGMNVIQRTVRAITTHFETKLDPMDRRKPVLLSPTVGFNMATNSAKQNGPEVDYVVTSDLPNNELTAARLETHFERGGTIPDMMLLTPANNPTAQSSNPEILRGVINTMIEKNKGIIFIFDMAYMWTIPREKAMQIMEVLKETGADQRAVFIVSESKRMGRPGTRIAGAIIKDEALKQYLDLHTVMQADTMSNEPSWSGELDTYYQAVSDESIIPESTFDDLSALLRQRQRAFLEVIKDIDPNHEYFDQEIERIVIPGDGNERQGDFIEQDIPLYLWLKLKEGVNTFDVLKKLGIGGAPSEVFGPEHGDSDTTHLRLSMGFVSTSDILSKSKKVRDQWTQRIESN